MVRLVQTKSCLHELFYSVNENVIFLCKSKLLLCLCVCVWTTDVVRLEISQIRTELSIYTLYCTLHSIFCILSNKKSSLLLKWNETYIHTYIVSLPSLTSTFLLLYHHSYHYIIILHLPSYYRTKIQRFDMVNTSPSLFLFFCHCHTKSTCKWRWNDAFLHVKSLLERIACCWFFILFSVFKINSSFIILFSTFSILVLNQIWQFEKNKVTSSLSTKSNSEA